MIIECGCQFKLSLISKSVKAMLALSMPFASTVYGNPAVTELFIPNVSAGSYSEDLTLSLVNPTNDIIGILMTGGMKGLLGSVLMEMLV